MKRLLLIAIALTCLAAIDYEIDQVVTKRFRGENPLCWEYTGRWIITDANQMDANSLGISLDPNDPNLYVLFDGRIDPNDLLIKERILLEVERKKKILEKKLNPVVDREPETIIIRGDKFKWSSSEN